MRKSMVTTPGMPIVVARISPSLEAIRNDILNQEGKAVIKFDAEVEVSHPLETVWAYVGDLRREPEYSPLTVEAELEGREPIATGTRFAGRRLDGAAVRTPPGGDRI